MTDHYQAALDACRLSAAATWKSDPDRAIQEAQVHAVLALGEQQRIANLIALWQDEDAPGTSQEASSALIKREPVSEGYGLKLRPEIARALRIERNQQ